MNYSYSHGMANVVDINLMLYVCTLCCRTHLSIEGGSRLLARAIKGLAAAPPLKQSQRHHHSRERGGGEGGGGREEGGGRGRRG